MTTYDLYWESMKMVSHKTKLVEYGVFWMGGAGSVTITIYLIFMSKWIATSSSVTSKILLDSILTVIFWMVIFVTVYVFLEYILYFAPPMCREDRTDCLIPRMLIQLRSIFPYMIVSHRWLSYKITIPESSPHFFLSKWGISVLSDREEI